MVPKRRLNGAEARVNSFDPGVIYAATNGRGRGLKGSRNEQQ